MADFYEDQAAGLRRLLGGPRLQVIAFVSASAGVGQTAIVANVGAALAQQGKEVLIIDESTGPRSACAALGVAPAGDLAQVILGQAALTQVLLEPRPRLRILPAARAVGGLARLSARQRQSTLEAISTLPRPIDVVLIDAHARHICGLSPFTLAAQDCVVTVSGRSTHITEAYALIKAARQRYGRRDFRLLLTRMPDQATAQGIFQNLAHTARTRAGATLRLAGLVPIDPSLSLAGRAGSLLVDQSHSAAASACRGLARALSQWPAPASCSNVLQFMQQLLAAPGSLSLAA